MFEAGVSYEGQTYVDRYVDLLVTVNPSDLVLLSNT